MFDIKEYKKVGKNIVIELDEVEYVLDEKSINLIEIGVNKIPITRLIDGKSKTVNVQDVFDSLKKNGVIDYI